MTGRYNLENIKNQKVKDFVLKGISANLDERYHSVAEMEQAFDVAFPSSGYQNIGCEVSDDHGFNNRLLDSCMSKN